jgi:hypothetical protein
MIVYGLNRLPLAQESTQDLATATAAALVPETKAAAGTSSAAVTAPVLAEGSGSERAAVAGKGGSVRPADEDDKEPIKK